MSMFWIMPTVAIVAFFAGWVVGYKECSRNLARWTPEIWRRRTGDERE